MKSGGDDSTKQLLKYERERRGWSRSYVAERIKSDIQTIGRWERGETFPNPYFRQRLCELFEKNAEELGLIQKDGASHVSQVEEYSHFTDAQRTKIEWQSEHEEHEEHKEHREGDEEVVSEKVHHVSRTMHPVSPMSRFISEQGSGISCSLVIAGLTIVVAAVIISAPFWRLLASPVLFSSDTSSVRPKIVPGGTWVSPINGKSYSGIVNFSALAYPTHIGEPAINHVNFTANWQGSWRIVCTAYPPVVQNLYSCNADLQQLGAPAGPIRISFDVYDQIGDINFAPNGEHTILYSP